MIYTTQKYESIIILRRPVVKVQIFTEYWGKRMKVVDHITICRETSYFY